MAPTQSIWKWRYLSFVPAADKAAAGPWLDANHPGFGDGTGTFQFSRTLDSAADGPASWWVASIPATDGLASAMEAVADSVPTWKWFKVNQETEALEATNVAAASGTVGQGPYAIVDGGTPELTAATYLGLSTHAEEI